MSETKTLPVEKSEILFLYESTFNTPNGDPFTNEQRYDDETKKILVSDVRIKRYIRDDFYANGATIYVINDRSEVVAGEKLSGAAARMKALKKKFTGEDVFAKDKDGKVIKDKKGNTEVDALLVMQKCIDVRLFGGISTEEGDAVNLTGPVQFALLNPSLNAVDLRMHQNTSVFSSNVGEKERGAIGTTTVVPYAVNQIHGWINPYSAAHTALTEADIAEMFKALWQSINNINTRTKANQNSLLLLQVVYTEPNKKLYGLERLISLATEKQGEQLRNSDDYTLDFNKLNTTITNSAAVQAVRYYTESETLKSQLAELSKQSNSKFQEVKELWTVSR